MAPDMSLDAFKGTACGALHCLYFYLCTVLCPFPLHCLPCPALIDTTSCMPKETATWRCGRSLLKPYIAFTQGVSLSVLLAQPSGRVEAMC